MTKDELRAEIERLKTEVVYLKKLSAEQETHVQQDYRKARRPKPIAEAYGPESVIPELDN